MARAKKQVFAELTPKNERARTRMSYHTNKWIVKRETANPYCGAKTGTWLLLESRNGKAMLWVMKADDQDFGVQVLNG